MLSHHPRTAHPSLRSTRRARGEHGYVMVTFALLLVPLLLMVGFAVDVGGWYSRASDMRRAADAAALAGVVWLPDEAAARTAALEAAARNGFVPSANISITVTASAKSDRRIKVTISDNRVGSFFYQSLGGRKIALSRTSYAEYVLAVPMGSPRNFFGTGTLLRTYTSPGMPAEDLYQSVNPYCTDKQNGDRFQSGYEGDTCAGTANAEYRTAGYSMYIEAPKNRTAAIDVRLYDARYNNSDISWQVPGPDNCVTGTAWEPATGWEGPTTTTANATVTGPGEYQTRASSTTTTWSATVVVPWGSSFSMRGDRIRYREATQEFPATWTGPTGSSTNITINAPAQYQTRANSTTTTWGATSNLYSTSNSGAGTYTFPGNRLRYKLGTLAQSTICTPTTVTQTERPIDEKRQSGDESYTYTLYAADNTPLDDSDNPQMCQQTFTKDTAFDGTDYLGSKRWNTLCSIPSNALSGRYILRVTNGGAITNPEADGSNQWGLVAKYANSGTDGLCDGRNDVMCPRVFGKDAISVRAASDVQVASFYLAEIAPEHAGKKLKLQLFDPGEGGTSISIMRPTGTNGQTWTQASFSWSAQGVTAPASASNVTAVDVTNSKFNGKLLEITIDLAGYSPPSNNDWWQVQYTFTGAQVTDRTTWSARIIGDPVHLVEEY